MKKRRGFIMTDFLGWWILALIVLAVVSIIVFTQISPKGMSMIEYLKNLWRFK